MPRSSNAHAVSCRSASEATPRPRACARRCSRARPRRPRRRSRGASARPRNAPSSPTIANASLRAGLARPARSARTSSCAKPSGGGSGTRVKRSVVGVGDQLGDVVDVGGGEEAELHAGIVARAAASDGLAPLGHEPGAGAPVREVLGRERELVRGGPAQLGLADRHAGRERLGGAERGDGGAPRRRSGARAARAARRRRAAPARRPAAGACVRHGRSVTRSTASWAIAR